MEVEVNEDGGQSALHVAQKLSFWASVMSPSKQPSSSAHPVVAPELVSLRAVSSELLIIYQE